ncbi:Tubulin-specific chaperone C [Halotydeus destructor]|nr:Tubulin-specific chaperone C [Halotydeus destructor]
MGDTKQSDINKFLSSFSSKKNEIESFLASCDVTSQAAGEAKEFGKVVDDYEQLKELLNEANEILPAYNAKVSQDTLKMISESIEKKRQLFKPKKKFAFKTSTFKKPEAESSQNKVNDEVDRVGLSHSDPGSMAEFNGLRSLTNESVIMHSDQTNEKTVQFVDLTNCTIEVQGHSRTVFMKNLKDCIVKLGPVQTSVFVNDCSQCSFQISCQQLRIHNSVTCDFYVATISKPIIEDCSKLRFGKYDYTYEKVDQDFEKSSIDRANCHWNEVIDFCWLSTESPSPNWVVIS